MSEPERLASILARRGTRFPRGAHAGLSILKENWAIVAGDRIAEHSRPTKLNRGTLTVSAEGSSWAAEVSACAQEVLCGAQRMLGRQRVKKVRVRSGFCNGEKGVDEVREERVEEGEPEELQEGELGRGLNRISDSDLRRALSRMVSASKAIRQSKQR